MCRENDFRLNTDSIKSHSTLYSFGNFSIRQYDNSTNWHSVIWSFGKSTIRWNDVSEKWRGPIRYLIYFHIFVAQWTATSYECEDEPIVYYPHSVEFIVINFKKKNIIPLHDLIVFQYIFSTCQQAFSFSHKIQFIYFSIYLFPSRGLCT